MASVGRQEQQREPAPRTPMAGCKPAQSRGRPARRVLRTPRREFPLAPQPRFPVLTWRKGNQDPEDTLPAAPRARCGVFHGHRDPQTAERSVAGERWMGPCTRLPCWAGGHSGTPCSRWGQKGTCRSQQRPDLRGCTFRELSWAGKVNSTRSRLRAGSKERNPQAQRAGCRGRGPGGRNGPRGSKGTDLRSGTHRPGRGRVHAVTAVHGALGSC